MAENAITQILLDLWKSQSDLAGLALRGAVDFEETSPSVRAILITRIIHPDLAEVLDRPEEFSGLGLPEGQLDVPSPAVHARIHALVLENAMTNQDAASALHNLLSEAGRHHEEVANALHVAVHILMTIQLQQLWGASVAARGETATRRRQGEAALREANAWFTNISKGRLKKLPRSFRHVLRDAPAHPAW